MHIVLVGDSILDNASYTSGGPSVVEHLVSALGASGTATLLAIDGSMTGDISPQLERLPEDASHLVLSVGGNDAMMEVEILTRPAESVWDALTQLSLVVDEFEARYRKCLAAVVATGVPVTTCTVYNGAFDEATGEQRVVSMALHSFNNAILQASLDVGCPIIDLRRVCGSRSDYANPIEPNAEGGRKIAEAILHVAESYVGDVSIVVPSGRGGAH